jgi:two-component system chemotaxis sensor kinase CheA
MTEGQRPSSEFLSEAQEVIEAFSRNLLQLDAQQRSGDYDPDLLNAAFRAIHSLKGLAALFGAGTVAALSHALESTLDSLRLGRIPLSQDALDVLFEAVEQFQGMLGAFGRDEPDGFSPDALLGRIAALTPAPAAADPGGASLAGLDESILGVLTEYEEHRLRENIRMGRSLFRVHASFDLLAIDVGIEALKNKMKAYGEVITYLPSADASGDDRIDLDILLGAESSLSEIAAGVGEDGVTVHELATGRAEEPRPQPSSRASGGSMARQVSARPASSRASELDAAEERAIERGVSLGDDHEPIVGVDHIEGEGPELSLRSLSQTVRVELSRLDLLMNLIGELGVVQANLATTLEALRAASRSSDMVRELQMHLRSMDRKLSLLQQGILEVRMVPLGQVFDKLARVVRKLGREAGKEIRLGISGADTELDKLIVEELSDPLMHMIRNCIDHGIETKEERVEAGKQPVGRIELRAFQKGNRVVIEVEDDGRGMEWRDIRTVAVDRGLVNETQSRELTMPEVIDFIFMPGFTTRRAATAVSGRGVGMDVVKTNISRLSGLIDVDTHPGRGTRFAITLPVTLAIIQALVIQTAGQTFCVPLNSVLESIMVRKADIATVEGHEVISLRGKTLPLLHLADLFELRAGRRFVDPERIYVVIVGLAQHRVGLVVDELLGQQDVVIKPLVRALRSVPGIAGATELGGGRTVLLLDVSTLVEESVGREPTGATTPHGGRGPITPSSPLAGTQRKEPRPHAR